MHKAPRFIPVVVLIILMGVFAVFLASRASGESTQITATGTIEMDSIFIAPETAGRVSEVLVEEGEYVTAGQPMVTLDASLFRAQRAQAEAALQAAQAGARAAQASLDLLLAGPTEAQLRLSQAGVDQAQINLDAAQQAFDDLPEYQRELATGKALLQQLERAQVALEAANAQFDLVEAGARREQIQATREQVAAADAQVQSAEAALAVLDVQMNRLNLVSPIDGTVIERNIHAGEFAAPGSVLLVLGNTSAMTLVVYVPGDRIGEVRTGQPVEVSVDSFPDEVFTGEVSRIADQAEFTPRNVQTSESRKTTVFAVTLTLAESNGKLKAGMPADVVFK